LELTAFPEVNRKLSLAAEQAQEFFSIGYALPYLWKECGPAHPVMEYYTGMCILEDVRQVLRIFVMNRRGVGQDRNLDVGLI
jgi:hypothetical protein